MTVAMNGRRFRNRSEAGRLLAAKLAAYARRPEVIVLALPRGGVPVAYEVAQALEAPLDVFLVRKLGVPGQEEFAMGAIATGGVRVINQDVVRGLRIPPPIIDEIAAREQQELERRERLYRDNRPARSPRDRMTILVDDGLATGSTMRAAALGIRWRRGVLHVCGGLLEGPAAVRVSVQRAGVDVYPRAQRREPLRGLTAAQARPP